MNLDLSKVRIVHYHVSIDSHGSFECATADMAIVQES